MTFFNNEVLLTVFQQLPLTEVVGIERVNKRFTEVAQQFYNTVHSVQLPCTSLKADKCRYLRSFAIPYVKDGDVSRYAQSLISSHKFIKSFVTGIHSYNEVYIIAKYAEQRPIYHVSVYFSSNDEGAYLENWNLILPVLASCSSLNISVYGKWWKAKFIAEVSVRQTSCVCTNSRKIFRKFLHESLDIQKAEVMNIHTLEDQDFKTLATKHPNLRSLTVRYLSGFHWLGKCTHLTDLSVYVVDDGFDSNQLVQVLNANSNLRKLKLIYRPNDTSQVCAAIGTMHKLQELEFSCVKEQGLIDAVIASPCLRTLKFSGGCQDTVFGDLNKIRFILEFKRNLRFIFIFQDKPDGYKYELDEKFLLLVASYQSSLSVRRSLTIATIGKRIIY